MADAFLPDMSRLTLETDTKSGEKYIIGRTVIYKLAQNKKIEMREQLYKSWLEAEAEKAEAEKSQSEQLLQFSQIELESYAMKETMQAHTALTRAFQDMKNPGATSQAALNVYRYKTAMDNIQGTYPILMDTQVWRDSIERYVNFLSDAALLLEGVTNTILTDLIERNDVEYLGNAQKEQKKLINLIKQHKNSTWKQRVDSFIEYTKLRDKTLHEANAAVAAMNEVPIDTMEHALWRQDLFDVIRNARETEITGITSIINLTRRLRREKQRNKMTRTQIINALRVPTLSKHMQVVYDVVTRELDRLQEVIRNENMRVGSYVREQIDFGDFGLGICKVQYTISKSQQEKQQRTSLNMQWFRKYSNTAIPVKAELAKMRTYLHISKQTAIRSMPELTRFLFWLDTTLTVNQKEKAKSWSEMKPSTSKGDS